MTGAARPPPSAESERPWRWVIMALIFAGTLVNYIDRQTVSALAPVLCRDLHLSNTQYGAVGSVFLLTYALSMWLWGGMFDWAGNKLAYALAIGLWSLSEIAHAAVRGLVSLSLFRGALGVGESGNWPGATRTAAAWFAPRQRALAMGIANAGASIGPAVGLPLVVALYSGFGWRRTFVITGLFGFLWLALWIPLYPRRPRRTEAGAADRGESPARRSAVPWRVLLRQPPVWGIILARFFGDPIWWLYLNWLPKYLHDAHHFSLQEIGASAWVPYVFAGLGALSGGWLSGFLIERGWTVHRARTTVIVFATVLLPAGVIAAYATSPVVIFACFSITLYAFQVWVSNVQTLPSDFYPVGAVGSIAGFSGTAAGLGAMIFTYSTGWVVDRFSYTPILIAAGALAPVATGALFLFAGRIRKIAAFA